MVKARIFALLTGREFTTKRPSKYQLKDEKVKNSFTKGLAKNLVYCRKTVGSADTWNNVQAVVNKVLHLSSAQTKAFRKISEFRWHPLNCLRLKSSSQQAQKVMK